MPTSGVAARRDLLFAYDGAIPTIVVLDRARAVTIGQFGRTGDGPGELRVVRSSGVMPRVLLHDWIATVGDSVVVLDGRRLHLFSADGQPIRDWYQLPAIGAVGAPLSTQRIRVVDGDVLMDLGRIRTSDYKRTFDILRFDVRGGVDTLFTIEPPDLPRLPSGATYEGVREARTLWDTWSGCFVLSDGTSPMLLVGQIGSSSVDTLDIRVPLRSPSMGSEADAARLSGVAKPPEPSRLWRIRRLVVSPDGWIWVQPVQPEGVSGVEVFRVNPRLGVQSIDTVPVFPTVFGDPGEYFGVAGTRSLGYRLQRVRLSNYAPAAR